MKLWRYGRSIEQLAHRYRLDGSLGSGGMADVCLAWDERDRREVAVKVIRPDSLDQLTLDRFLKEAAQVARWQHPHILHVYSDLKLELLDPSQGAIVPYIVMEYAQGGDLQKRLSPGQPYPLGKTLDIFSQLCSAVAYAHDQGVIHRDLKPLNVLFRSLPTEPDEVVLSDFGLAVEISATHHTFARAGTLPYMAPEQLQGHVEAASDIFALGVILYQLCTGRLPFRRSLQDLRRSDPIPPPRLPSSIVPHLPPALDDAILIALSEQPADRYADASQFWEYVQIAIASLQNTTERARYNQTTAQNNRIDARAASTRIAPDTSPHTAPVPRGYRASAQPQPHILPVATDAQMDTPSAYPDSSADIAQQGHTPARGQGTSASHIVSTPSHTRRAPNAQIVTKPRPTYFIPISLRLHFIAPAALLLILIAGGIIYFAPSMRNRFIPASPTVSTALNPASLPVQLPYSIPTSSVNFHEVTFSQSQPQPVQGTGHKQIPATQAKGELTFLNAAFVTKRILTGTTILGKDGIQVVTDAEADILSANVNNGTTSSFSVPVHAIDTGAKGNIVSLDINQIMPTDNSIFVKNLNAFTGGQDAQSYQFVQQVDVQNATNPIIATLTQQVQGGLQARLSGNERMVGATQCTSNVGTDPQHPVGDTGVNVPAISATITVRCRAEAYDAVRLKDVLGQLLSTHTKRPGRGYRIVLRLVSPPVVQVVGGQDVLVGNVSGDWVR